VPTHHLRGLEKSELNQVIDVRREHLLRLVEAPREFGTGDDYALGTQLGNVHQETKCHEAPGRAALPRLGHNAWQDIQEHRLESPACAICFDRRPCHPVPPSPLQVSTSATTR
jgi:hypothetical protein